jgi:uncharacterized membrane protein YeaQ/YmgE (transglycosylase-associated protein family)
MLETIISLVSGALGGNAAGGLLKKYSLGTIGNSIVGILGGGIGGYVLNALGLGGASEVVAGAAEAVSGGGLELSSIVGNLVSGGAGGGILLTIVGLIKNMMNKS